MKKKHRLETIGSKKGYCGNHYCDGNCGVVTYKCSCGIKMGYSKDIAEKKHLEHRIDELESR